MDIKTQALYILETYHSTPPAQALILFLCLLLFTCEIKVDKVIPRSLR